MMVFANFPQSQLDILANYPKVTISHADINKNIFNKFESNISFQLKGDIEFVNADYECFMVRGSISYKYITCTYSIVYIDADNPTVEVPLVANTLTYDVRNYKKAASGGNFCTTDKVFHKVYFDEGHIDIPLTTFNIQSYPKELTFKMYITVVPMADVFATGFPQTRNITLTESSSGSPLKCRVESLSAGSISADKEYHPEILTGVGTLNAVYPGQELRINAGTLDTQGGPAIIYDKTNDGDSLNTIAWYLYKPNINGSFTNTLSELNKTTYRVYNPLITVANPINPLPDGFPHCANTYTGVGGSLAIGAPNYLDRTIWYWKYQLGEESKSNGFKITSSMSDLNIITQNESEITKDANGRFIVARKLLYTPENNCYGENGIFQGTTSAPNNTRYTTCINSNVIRFQKVPRLTLPAFSAQEKKIQRVCNTRTDTIYTEDDFFIIKGFAATGNGSINIKSYGVTYVWQEKTASTDWKDCEEIDPNNYNGVIVTAATERDLVVAKTSLRETKFYRQKIVLKNFKNNTTNSGYIEEVAASDNYLTYEPYEVLDNHKLEIVSKPTATNLCNGEKLPETELTVFFTYNNPLINQDMEYNVYSIIRGVKTPITTDARETVVNGKYGFAVTIPQIITEPVTYRCEAVICNDTTYEEFSIGSGLVADFYMSTDNMDYYPITSTNDIIIYPGTRITLNNMSTEADEYLWNLVIQEYNDSVIYGTTSALENPSCYIYNKGYHKLKLTAYSKDLGCIDSVEINNIYVPYTMNAPAGRSHFEGSIELSNDAKDVYNFNIIPNILENNTLNFYSNCEEYTFDIYTTTGLKIYSGKMSYSGSIDIELPQGIFLVKINNQTTIKIIKK